MAEPPRPPPRPDRDHLNKLVHLAWEKRRQGTEDFSKEPVPIDPHRQYRYKRPQDPKHLVLCLDGTSNEYGENESNVLRFFELLDQKVQKTYYQPGVGTSAPAGSTFFRWYAIPTSTWSMLKWETLKAYDLMYGGSVGTHVQNAYRWACDNYHEGDKISIIGFSRGAHTARILAAMILSIGLLEPGMHEAIPKAYDAYLRIKRRQDGDRPYEGFKDDLVATLPSQIRRSARSIVKLNFLGLFDTVSEMGFHGLRDRETCKELCLTLQHVERVAHALSIDEKRRQFLPTPIKGRSEHPNFRQDVDARASEKIPEELEVGSVRERWFVGAHSDVGGGYRHDMDDRGDLRLVLPPAEAEIVKPPGFWTRVRQGSKKPLRPLEEPKLDLPNIYRARASNIPLRWMVSEAARAEITFDYDAIYGASALDPAREELRIDPHESYLHFTHPVGAMQYKPFRDLQAAIRELEDRANADPSILDDAWHQAKALRSAYVNTVLVHDAANLDSMTVPDLIRADGASWIHAIPSTVHDTFPDWIKTLHWHDLYDRVGRPPSLRHTCVLLDLSTGLHDSRDMLYKLIPPWGVARRIFNDSDPKEWSWPVKLRILCGRREPTDFVAPDPKVPSKMHESVSARWQYSACLPLPNRSLTDFFRKRGNREHELTAYRPAIAGVRARLKFSDPTPLQTLTASPMTIVVRPQSVEDQQIAHGAMAGPSGSVQAQI